MYYLEDICILCLKNDVELHSVFIQDIDGIAFNEKLRCCFPEKFDSTPDTHKLACLECFAKLRFLYESKQSAISNITVMRNYLDKLQCENKTFQQPSVVLSARKRRRKDLNIRNLPEIEVENVENSFKIKIKNLNLNSTNDEQLNKIDHPCNSTTNENALLTKYNCLTEEKDLETINVEKDVPVTETGSIYVKEEPQFTNLNLNSTNEEQLSTIGHSRQPTTNENIAFLTEYNCLTVEKDLETKNVEKDVPVTETGSICVNQEPPFSNYNLNSENEQLNTVDHSYQPTANKNVTLLTEYNCLTEENDLGIKIVEKVVPVTKTGIICVKQESHSSNFNLNSTNEQLNTVDHFYPPTANESDAFLTEYNCLPVVKDLETKNVEKVVPFTGTGTICVNQEPQFSNYNPNSPNEEQLNTVDQSYQPTVNKNVAILTEYNCLTEERNLETGNVEKVLPVTETIYIKQEPHFFQDDSTISYLDEDAEDSEGSRCINEDDPNFEIPEEGTSRYNDYINQKVNAILNSLKLGCESKGPAKFCNTCQELLFKDLVNINMHLFTHIQSSNCSRCEDSLEEINKFQRHMFNHCEPVFEIIDKGEYGEKFSCSLCDQQFDEFSNLRKHIINEHIKSLKCVICSGAFTLKHALVRHILVIHCRVKIYKCKICFTRFSYKSTLMEHVFYQHYKGTVCVCKYCHQTFRNPKTLREHISRHTEQVLRLEKDKLLTNDSSKNSDAAEILFCAVCHEQFNDINNFKIHIYHKHMPSLNCVICSGSFAERTTLHRHILKKHCNVNILKCIICSTQFTSKESFKNHTIYQHNNGKPLPEPDSKGVPIELVNGEKFTCSICNKQFDVLDSLRRHIYNEHITGLDCVVCSNTYCSRVDLNRHILKVHCDLKFFKCVICSIKFISKDSFKNHMIHQHNDGKTITELENKVQLVNGEKFTCTICKNQFEVLESLKQHIYDEHITGLHCVVCSKICCRKEYLNRHILEQHCLIKIFKCKLCPHRFACRESFEDHMNQQHSSDKELDNIVGAVTELENNVGPVTKPEEIFIKEEPYYSYDNSSDEEYEADNNEIGKKISNTAMAEESNSRTSNSSNLEEIIGSSVIPNAAASTSASYCEPSVPADQSRVCDICQKMFLFLNNISEHLNAHMQVSSCSMCKDSAENISRLQRHMLTPCGNTNTSQHTASTTDTGDNEKITCIICQKKFNFDTLKKHLNTHITNLTCVVCNKTIINKKNLRLHLLRHFNLRLFQCEVCGKKFSVKAALNYHMKNVQCCEGYYVSAL